MDAAGERCSLQPLVLLAEHPHSVAGARRDRAGRLDHMAGIGWCIAVWRLHRRRRPIRALLYRHHHQPLPDDRAASLYADAGGVPSWHAGVSPRRHAVPAAGDPLLLRLVLLGVPRQGARRCRLSLRFSIRETALVDPPASSYAIMRRAGPYRGENPVPGKDVRGELTPRPELENSIDPIRT